jgi:hypothetical protein
VFRRIFGHKREELAEGRRRLHNEGLHDLNASPNIIRVIKSRRMRWVGHAACVGGMKHAYNSFVEKPEGKRALERLKRRWEDFITIHLRKMAWEGVDWIHLAQDRDQ